MSKNEGWIKPEKHIPIACFCKKNKSNENNNFNNNRYEIFTDDVELDAEHEADLIEK